MKIFTSLIEEGLFLLNKGLDSVNKELLTLTLQNLQFYKYLINNVL